MSKRKMIITLVCVVLGIAALSAAVYAAVSYGSKDDPLISKSYLDSVVKPQLEADFEAELEAAIADMEAESSGDFVVITLKNGQSVTCDVGCEVMLRIGSASAVGPDYPVLVDTTSGESAASGTAMKTNHLYMVTIRGNGFKATADNTKLLIKGDYTIN